MGNYSEGTAYFVCTGLGTVHILRTVFENSIYWPGDGAYIAKCV